MVGRRFSSCFDAISATTMRRVLFHDNRFSSVLTCIAESLAPLSTANVFSSARTARERLCAFLTRHTPISVFLSLTHTREPAFSLFARHTPLCSSVLNQRTLPTCAFAVPAIIALELPFFLLPHALREPCVLPLARKKLDCSSIYCASTLSRLLRVLPSSQRTVFIRFTLFAGFAILLCLMIIHYFTAIFPLLIQSPINPLEVVKTI